MGPDSYVVSVSRDITADAADIFALLVDPARHHELDGMDSVQAPHDGAGRLELGGHFDMHMSRGFSYSTRNTVTQLEPDRLITWSTRPITFPLSLLIGGRTWSYRLEPTDAGTRVTETWDASGEKNRAVVRRLAGDVASGMTETLVRIERALAA